MRGDLLDTFSPPLFEAYKYYTVKQAFCKVRTSKKLVKLYLCY
nr:MAG TPA: hypothetical protein [Caudoviricetes sp.]